MESEGGIRILLVDDSPEQRREIISVIRDPGLEVVEAGSGLAGLELLETGEFAVILIDVRMPGMNGFELAERIRKLEPARNTPIMFITSTQVPDACIREGYSLGAVDFLIVPVIPEIIRAKVEFFAAHFQRQEVRSRQSEQLEEKVRERTAELLLQNAVNKSLTDNAASGLFMLDREKRIVFMNPAAELAFGLSFDEIRGRDLHDVAHPEGKDGRSCLARECPLEMALASATPVRNLGDVFYRESGQPFSVSCSMSPLHPGTESVGNVVEFQDVTEHRQAEDRLKRSEDRYRRLFETAQDGILILDAEAGRIVDVNPFLADLLGYSRKEILGKELWEIGLFRDINANQEVFRNLRSRGYVRYDDLPLQTKDGNKKEVEFVSNVYKVGDESVVQCNIRDVTDRKRMEESLRRTEADLRQAQKTEALGKLSGGIAHDFNNLLTAINGYSDLCLGMADQEGTMREYLEEILKAGQRAASLTHQLLAFSRQQVLAPKILNLNGNVTEILNLLRRLIGENIRLTPKLDTDLWLTRADPVQIQQVLLNLAVNARDAVPQGGEITIRTENVHADQDVPANASGWPNQASVLPNRQYVKLSVSDTGKGIETAVMARIFEPFFTTKEFGKGAGMGLATVDGIVRQSGGHLTVESNPGKGSTFAIYLVRAEEEDMQAEIRPVAKTKVNHGSENVLMAEDDPMVRTFTRRILEMHGYKVLEAEDGESALALCSGFVGTIHLLLTDILMPGMNGRDLSDRFRERFPQTPVIFMSGYTNEVVMDMGMMEEGSLLVQKPFSPARLIEVVRQALDLKLQSG